VIFKVMFSQWFWSKTILLCTPTVNVPTDVSDFLYKLDHSFMLPDLHNYESFLLHENLLIVAVLGTIAAISAPTHGGFFVLKPEPFLPLLMIGIWMSWVHFLWLVHYYPEKLRALNMHKSQYGNVTSSWKINQ
jgi:hypothetical protein